VNEAFQGKLAWRILKNEPSLWVQAMQAKYFNKSTFLQYNSKCYDSQAWKNILKFRLLLKHGIQWKVGKGDKISFWFDNCIKNRNLFYLLNVQPKSMSQPHATVSDFITLQRRWNLPKLNQALMNSPIIQKIKGIDIQSTTWNISFVGDLIVLVILLVNQLLGQLINHVC